MTPTRRSAVVALGIAAVTVLAACGSRLPDSDFASGGLVVSGAGRGSAAGSGAGSSGAGQGTGSPAPSGSTSVPGSLPGALPGLAGAVTGGDSGASAAPSGVQNAPGGTGTSTAPGKATTGTTGSTGAGKTGTGKTGTGKTGTGKTGTGVTSTATSGAGAGNTSSDRGVSTTRIEVGNIVSSGGEFGKYEFTPNYYGAAAYFAYINAHGGVHGRLIDFKACPDGGDATSNTQSVHTCIDTDKVFAFAGNDVFDYAGASYVQSQDIPDVGGEPVDDAYNSDSHLYAMGGVNSPRDGHDGYDDGKLWSGSQVGLFFKQAVGVTHLGIVYYDESDSEKGANETEGEYSNVGVTTSRYSVNLGLPNFASAVAQMQADGVDAVADELDEDGNQKLCQAIEQNSAFSAQLKAKISTEASWTSRFGSDFSSTPGCRDKSYATGLVANYQDTSIPQVALFRSEFTKDFGSNSAYLAEWALHGWISAMWLTDAMTSCGANLTRGCVETFMNSSTKYTARGLLDPSSFVSPPESTFTAPGATSNDCVSAAQWSDANGGGWVTRADVTKNCYTTPWYSFDTGG